ncbi:transposase [Arthrobacter silviterrae]|uniref:Transposase n=1 Tax=Arthrobacter silviterrae TaxID=2026658 RepID=A0ABX0DEK3_9MICC|nr:transposase [Arthrobacter silviterrae]MDQ0277424.1 transposase [Arthrobacter silviterrae]NGN85309.1 transposase [Arthrobacter silviterrae]
MTERNKYLQKYKDGAAGLVLSSGRPIAQVGVDVGVNEGTLGNWLRQYRKARPEKFAAQEKRPVSLEDHQRVLAEIAKQLKQHVEFGESQRLLWSVATVEDVYEFIEAEKANYPIA